MSVGASKSGSASSCHTHGSPLDVLMPMQHALAQEDLSAMRLLPVPHVGRPFDDCPPTAAAERDRPTGTAALEHQRAAETAFAEQVGGRPGEPGDGGHAWTR